MAARWLALGTSLLVCCCCCTNAWSTGIPGRCRTQLRQVAARRSVTMAHPMARQLASAALAVAVAASPLLSIGEAYAAVAPAAGMEQQAVAGEQSKSARRLQDPTRPQGEPTAAQVRIASDAFRLFDNRQLAASEKR
eukprot:TRINITY_DN4425_c0_g1_i1.p1 TRINITY_DN4425_c0_g1~~TRINITY_DN4425_c0_g1_i1.p1  ORF type:complete len:147 (-),score=20.15 TRINITY_DN4425_c0_g1_i1:1759-2169(-)